jgi:hypothetical protein
MAYRDRPVKGLPVASMANRVNAARTLIAHYCHHRERSEAISHRLGTSIEIAAPHRTAPNGKELPPPGSKNRGSPWSFIQGRSASGRHKARLTGKPRRSAAAQARDLFGARPAKSDSSLNAALPLRNQPRSGFPITASTSMSAPDLAPANQTQPDQIDIITTLQ